MLIDLHADTPLLMHWGGYDFCHEHRPFMPYSAWLSHVDLPRMQEAHMDAQVFGLVALPMEGDPLSTVMGQIQRVEQSANASGEALRVVRNGAQLRATQAQGCRAALLSVEGVHCLAGDLSRARMLVDRGVVGFGLAHFHANEACHPAKGLGADPSVGLTDFGVELVEALGSWGVIVDLTHINRRGFFDAVAHSTGPLWVSHSGIATAHGHWRNLDCQQVRAVASKGGVVGIMFSRHFLGGSDMDAVVRHILALVDEGGIETAALGSDFDGFIVPVRGLRDVRGLTALRETLERTWLTAQQVDQIMGGNALRVLDQVGDV